MHGRRSLRIALVCLAPAVAGLVAAPARAQGDNFLDLALSGETEREAHTGEFVPVEVRAHLLCGPVLLNLFNTPVEAGDRLFFRWASGVAPNVTRVGGTPDDSWFGGEFRFPEDMRCSNDRLTIRDVGSVAPEEAGTYHLYACPFPNLSLSSSCSNAITVRVIERPRPDLAVTSIAPERHTAVLGERLPFTVTVRNLGTASAIGTELEFTANRVTVLRILLPSMEPGETLERTEAVGIVRGESGDPVREEGLGVVRVSACANRAIPPPEAQGSGAAAEETMRNNCTPYPAQIRLVLPEPRLARLAVESAAADPRVAAGARTVTFSARVVNRGDATSVPASVHFFSSDDETLDTADTRLSGPGGVELPPLAPGEREEVEFGFRPPADLTGATRVAACVDDPSLSAETKIKLADRCGWTGVTFIRRVGEDLSGRPVVVIPIPERVDLPRDGEGFRFPDRAGDTFAEARDLGILCDASIHGDFLNGHDSEDFYRFAIGGGGPTRVALGFGAADFDLILLDAGGSEIERAADRPESEEILRPLERGDYGVRVHRRTGAGMYSLSITAPIPEDRAGNRRGEALDIGTVEDPVRVEDEFVGACDPVDFYRFDKATAGPLTAALFDTREPPELRLLGDDGQGGFERIGNALDGSLEIEVEPGTFLLRVGWLEGRMATGYTLEIR